MLKYYAPVQYTLIKVESPGIPFGSPCTYYPVTTSATQLLKWLREVEFLDGLVEQTMNLSEGLAGVMETLEKMKSTRKPW